MASDNDEWATNFSQINDLREELRSVDPRAAELEEALETLAKDEEKFDFDAE